MSGTLFSVANAAFLRHQYAQAIGLYVEILRRRPELRGQAEFNLSLARRRYRDSRSGARTRVMVQGGAARDGDRAATLSALYRSFADVEIVSSFGREAGGEGAAAGNGRDPAPDWLDFVLSHPCDILHLCRPEPDDVVVGNLYKFVWDARVLVDIDGWHPDGRAVPGAEPSERIDDLSRTFDGLTTSLPALEGLFGATLLSPGRDDALSALALRDIGRGEAGPQDPAIGRSEGWDALRLGAPSASSAKKHDDQSEDEKRARPPIATEPTPEPPTRPRMTIAIVGEKLFDIGGGGGERSLTDLANAMAERDYEVHVIIRELDISRSQEPFYGLRPGIRIRNIYGWLEDDISLAEGDPPKWERLHRIIADIDPDVVIAFFLPEFSYVARAVKELGVPLVLSHRNDPKMKMAALAKRDRKRVAQTMEAYVSCQLMTVQLAPYVEMLPDHVRSKTVIIPNAVLQPEPDMLATPEAQGEANVILNVARLVPAKNQALLIRAFAKISDAHPGWRVRIYGDGPLAPQLRSLIEELGMEDRIHLMGATKDIQQAYRDAKIFAFPSLYEGFSRALSEAMAHRLPSIGIDTCVCAHEFISASGGGMLCKNGTAAYAAALEALIIDPRVRAEMGRKANIFIQRYDQKAVYDQWEKYLLEVVINSCPDKPRGPGEKKIFAGADERGA